MNIDAPWPDLDEAERRVRRIQTKLHQRAAGDRHQRFDDLFNLVADPTFLVVAWKRVRGNRGARSAGVDGVAPRSIVTGLIEAEFLSGLRDELKARRFRPLPVRERMIPKPGTTARRRLGIPTARDRTVQAALKLVLEPIFEADFAPFSYGFRPGRRAQDAIAEIHNFTSRSYEWVLEGDIAACFDEISHVGLMDRVRARIGDRRILDLVKAFLRAGILSQDGVERDTITGTPQGGILSPLLANVALSVLDDHFAGQWAATGSTSYLRRRRRVHGLANCRLVRYADDFVVLVSGTEAHAQMVREEVAAVLAPMGLRLSPAKTRVCHIDEGFDFLGFRIQRRLKRGTRKRVVYTYPAKKSLGAVIAAVRTLTRRSANVSLSVLLYRLNPVLRGWCSYFRHGVSSATFGYLDAYAWHRVAGWIRSRHGGLRWSTLRRRYLVGSRPAEGGIRLFDPRAVSVTRYRYRSAAIPSPWESAPLASTG